MSTPGSPAKSATIEDPEVTALLSYFCPDAAITAQEHDATAEEIVRQTTAALKEAAWLQTVILQQKDTIKKLQEELELLEQQVQPVTADAGDEDPRAVQIEVEKQQMCSQGSDGGEDVAEATGGEPA